MFRKPRYTKTLLSVNNSTDGQSIERMCEKVMSNGEPIENTAPMIYTPKKDGVLPEYNIRTDRWDVALKAMDSVTASHRAKRDAAMKKNEPKPEDNKAGDGDGDGDNKAA